MTDALVLAPPPSRSYVVARRPVERAAARTGGLPVLAFSHLGADLLIGAFCGLLPRFQSRFGLSAAGVAVLAALLAGTSSFGQPFAGRLADRLGARALAVVGVLTTTTMLTVATMSPSFGTLALLTAVGGLGAALYHPSAAALARRTRPDRAGIALSMFGAGGTLGLAVGPILGLALVGEGRSTSAFLLLAPGLLAGVLLWIRMPADAPPRQPATRPRCSPAALTHLRPFVLAIALAQLAATAFTTAVPLWLAHSGHENLVGWALGLYAAAAAVSGVIAAAAVKYVSARALVTTTTAVGIVPLLLVVLIPPGTPAWFAAIGSAGALIHAGTPVLIAAAQDRSPDAVAAASGALMGLPVGAASVLYIPLATLAGPFGYPTVVVLAAGALVPAVAAVRRSLRAWQPAPDALPVATVCCGCDAGQGVLTPRRRTSRRDRPVQGANQRVAVT